MAALDKVCCIMDVDGFDTRVSTNGMSYRVRFLVRELAYVRVDPKQEFMPVDHRFNLRGKINLNNLSPQERRTLEYQSRKVTGLSILPTKDEVVQDYGNLESVVRGMYSTCRQPGLDVVAYKGGNKEKDLLDGLGIPCLDLGLFGCPPFAKLIENGKVYSKVRDCGLHKLADGRMAHCPKAEVVVFRDWYMLNYKKTQSTHQDGEFDSASSSDE